MLRRRAKAPVLTEVPVIDGASPRLGALNREQLAVYAEFAESLGPTATVFLTGPAKSQVALGLAAAGLAGGLRVALLECDLATPTLAATLGLAPRPGLRDHLSDGVDAEQVLQSLMLAGPAAGGASEPLVCIVAGEPVASPVALLDSDRCDQAIEQLRRAYQLLVIDGPPLEEDRDALQALREHSSATLVCAEDGEVPRRLPIEASGLVLFA